MAGGKGNTGIIERRRLGHRSYKGRNGKKQVRETYLEKREGWQHRERGREEGK